MALTVLMVWVRSRWKAMKIRWKAGCWVVPVPGGKPGRLGGSHEDQVESQILWVCPLRMDVGLAESCIQVSLCRFF